MIKFNALSYSAQNTNNIQKLLQQRLRLAVEDLQQGRLDAAEKSLGELLIQAPGDADILSLLGMAATRKGNPETAIPLMKRAITADPENTVHRFNLGTAYLSLFRYDDAVAVLNEFLTIDPRHAAAAFSLGKALQALGRNEEAALAFLGAMKNRPGYTKAISARAGCPLETGDIDSAAVLLRDSIAAHPEDLDLRFTLGRLMLLRREWNSAVEAFDAALSIRHWHVSSAAFKGIALREAGMDADAAAADGLDRLTDAPNFCQTFPQTLNEQLGNAVADHPSLFREREDKSTVGGQQTDNLVNESDGVVGRFVGALIAYVDSLVRNTPKDPSNLFARSIPQTWRYSIWATVLWDGGHQTSHLHPGGWLSGVYYVEVPDAISGDENRNMEGWIEFGRPGYGYEPLRAPQVRHIQPIPGRLIVFPSSVFHRTLPFQGDGRRISIAFDLIPTGG